MDVTSELQGLLEREQARAGRAVGAAWAQISATEDFDEAWRYYRPAAVRAAEGSQGRLVTAATVAASAQLAEQGLYLPAEGVIDAAGFVGFNGDGRPFVEALDGGPIRARALLKRGKPAQEALAGAGRFVTMVTQMMLADTVRSVLSVQTAVRPRCVYVRRTNAGACSRCLILAGRIYRWNQGFQRHPRCNCVHVPTVATVADQVAQDPYEIFGAMSQAEQDRAFGAAAAQAIRDGADMYQVVNARRGMQAGGWFTTEGTSKRGAWGRSPFAVPGRRRMTPEAIYRLSRSREEAIQQLIEHGYILPAGQVAGGSIRGRALGAGRYRAGRAAIARWERHGVRVEGDIHAMTAAERRLADARWQLSELSAGRNPFEAAAVERRFPGAPKISRGGGRALTPRERAQYEQSAHLMIAAGGDLTEYKRLRRVYARLLTH